MKLYRLVALLGLLCLAPQILHAQSAATSPAAAATAPAETRFPHISVQSIGQGDPVVLIPGLASPRAVWSAIAPELARGHRVLLVQVNGFGGDDPGANLQDGILAGAVADLVRYFDENRIARPAVIGHSMGGLIGMMLAKSHPDRVGRLMIVDSLPFFGVLMAPDATVETVRPVAGQLRTMLRGQTGAQPAPPNMSLTDAGRARIAAWMNVANRQVAGQAAYEDLTSDLRADVPAIGRVPTTVLYAVPDPAMAAMFRTTFAGAYAAAPSIRVIPVEGSAHFIMLDQPGRFRDAVMAFLGASQ
jgi:pimeloyl-ACP methyl ester carboxylesterase